MTIQISTSVANDAMAQLSLAAPAALSAWQRATANMSLRNLSTQPLLPVELTLSSGRGVLEQWGVAGRIVCWGQMVPARQTSTGWEVLLAPLVQQQTGPPSAQERQAYQTLVRIAPLQPGEAIEQHAYFEADYRHGERLTATLSYKLLDPARQWIGVVAAQPVKTGFVACQRVSHWAWDRDAEYYLLSEELERERRQLQVSCPLAIQHPTFDLPEARTRANLSAGPVGYDPPSARWILVDPQGPDTLLVSAPEPVEKLPGDWLDALIALNAAPVVQLTWETSAQSEIDELCVALAQAGIEASVYTHKGQASPARLLVTLSRANISELARVMREAGARLDGLQIVTL